MKMGEEFLIKILTGFAKGKIVWGTWDSEQNCFWASVDGYVIGYPEGCYMIML